MDFQRCFTYSSVIVSAICPYSPDIIPQTRLELKVSRAIWTVCRWSPAWLTPSKTGAKSFIFSEPESRFTSLGVKNGRSLCAADNFQISNCLYSLERVHGDVECKSSVKSLSPPPPHSRSLFSTILHPVITQKAGYETSCNFSCLANSNGVSKAHLTPFSPKNFNDIKIYYMLHYVPCMVCRLHNVGIKSKNVKCIRPEIRSLFCSRFMFMKPTEIDC